MKTKSFFLTFSIVLIVLTLFPTVQSQPQKTYLKVFEKGDTFLRIPTISLSDSLVSYQETKDFYQFNVTLFKATPSNIFSFNIETKGLEFYYQPPLDEMIKADGTTYDFVNATHAMLKGQILMHRPENVVGSYAVYRSDGKTGNQYGTGKLYHIYRPLLVDAKGVTSWANLTVTKTKLTVTCDPVFLAQATYPVIIDPTFGYTTIGGSSSGANGNYLYTSMYALSEAGTVTDIRWYGRQSNAANSKCLIYSDSSGNPNTLLVTSNETSVGTSNQWWVFSASGSLSAGNYWLTFFPSQFCYIYFDSASANLKAKSATYPNAPNPFGTPSATYDYKMSIYATYTASGGGEAYTQTITETLKTLDTIQKHAAYMRLTAETVTIADTLARYAAFQRVTTETLNIADGVTRYVAFQRQVTETLHILDGIARHISFQRYVTETLHVTSAIASTTYHALLQIITETLHVADAAARSGAFTRFLTETLHIPDSALASALFNRVIAELLTILDAIAHAAGVFLGETLLVDTVSLSDSATLTVTSLTVMDVLGIAALALIFAMTAIALVLLFKRND